jgi:hypothetical protein
MPTRAPGNSTYNYGEMVDLLLGPARVMTMQGPEMPGMWGKLHNAIDPVQAFGGYGNMAGAIMGGPGAKTANLNQLAFAKAAEKAKMPTDVIWEATGWGKGKDGKWRFEIPDDKAHLWSDTANELKAGGYHIPLKGGGRFSHPELYSAYPELANVKLHGKPEANYLGQQRGMDINLAPQSRPRMQSTLLHELQHELVKIRRINDTLELIKQRESAISRAGGYERNQAELRALGQAQEKLLRLRQDLSQRNSPHDMYRKTSGEVEARNVQHRESWGPQKRKDVPPEFSEDVPRSKQHVIMR